MYKLLIIIYILISILYFDCKDETNGIYFIEDKNDSSEVLLFYGKNKAMYIHSEGNEIVLTTNMKLKNNDNRLESLTIELYDKNKDKLLNVPMMTIRSEDLKLLNLNYEKFHRVRFKFDYSNISEKNPNKRYQMARRWVMEARWFIFQSNLHSLKN